MMLIQQVTPAAPGVSTTFEGGGWGSGGLFVPVRRQGDADGLEDTSDLSLDVGARGDALAVLLDGGLLQAVEIADRIIPLDRDVGGPGDLPRPHRPIYRRRQGIDRFHVALESLVHKSTGLPPSTGLPIGFMTGELAHKGNTPNDPLTNMRASVGRP